MTERVLGPTGGRRRKRLALLLPFIAIAALILAISASAGPVSVAAGFEGDDGNLAVDYTRTITSISAANPTVITTSAEHGLSTGNTVQITGSNSTPSVDGTWQVTVTGLTTFTIPVNVTTAGTAGTVFRMDWNGFAPTTWTGLAPDRTSTKTANGWLFVGQEDAQETTSDDAFDGGVKQDDNCAGVGTGKAPNKDDLERIYLATKNVAGSVYLALAWVRIPQNTTSSSAHIGFEFNKGSTACATGGLVHRTLGDMLIVYDFEGSSTNAPNLTLRRWKTTGVKGDCEVANNTPPCWGPAQNLTASGVAEAKVNTSDVGSVTDSIAPSPPDTLGNNEFGEAIINLTAANVFSATSCESFGKAYAVSRSSGNSAQAQMKDLVGPVNFQLANCGEIRIIKQTSPRGLNENFGFTTTNFGSAGSDLTCSPDTNVVNGFLLNDNNNTGKTLGSPLPAQNSADNTETCIKILPGTYTVTEGADPGGFAFGTLTCSSSGGNSHSTSSKTATITVGPGGSTTCIYVNNQQTGAIKVTKTGKDKNCTGASATCQAAGNAFLSGAKFEIWRETNGTAGLQRTGGTPDTKAKDEQTTGSNGQTCFDGLTVGTYYAFETATKTGYKIDSATSAAQTVNAAGSCPSTGTVLSVSFTNTPLSQIRIQFTSLAGTGVTASQIVCKRGATTIEANSENGAADATPPAYDDTDETFGNGTSELVPGIYTCTIDIDP